jgi:hypothetical protein
MLPLSQYLALFTLTHTLSPEALGLPRPIRTPFILEKRSLSPGYSPQGLGSVAILSPISFPSISLLSCLSGYHPTAPPTPR